MRGTITFKIIQKLKNMIINSRSTRSTSVPVTIFGHPFSTKYFVIIRYRITKNNYVHLNIVF